MKRCFSVCQQWEGGLLNREVQLYLGMPAAVVEDGPGGQRCEGCLTGVGGIFNVSGRGLLEVRGMSGSSPWAAIGA